MLVCIDINIYISTMIINILKENKDKYENIIHNSY